MAVIGSILARLQADVSGLEKGLAVGGTGITTFEKRTAASLARIDNRMAIMAKTGAVGFYGLAKGAATALVPILGFTSAIQGAKDALKLFGDIADNSKAAGLDPELYQSLVYQFGLVGVEATAAAGALGVFAKNSGLAAEGKGRMVATLKALNPALLENIRAATTQAERVRLAADAIDKAGSASEKAALSTALFGDAGLKMVDAFSGGAAVIDQTMKKAKALGIVIDRELIDRADVLGDEFETATKVLDLQFKEVLVELAPILVSVAGGVAQLIRELQNLGSAPATQPAWPSSRRTLPTTKRCSSPVTGLRIATGLRPA